MKNFIKGLVFFIVIFIIMPTYGVALIERFVNLIPSDLFMNILAFILVIVMILCIHNLLKEFRRYLHRILSK